MSRKKAWLKRIGLFLVLGIVAAAAVVLFLGSPKKELKFELWEEESGSSSYTQPSSGKMTYAYEQFYFVEGYTKKNEDEFLRMADSIMCSCFDFNFTSQDFFNFIFLQKNEITNHDYLTKFPREYDRHSTVCDVIVAYSWDKFRKESKVYIGARNDKFGSYESRELYCLDSIIYGHGE